MSQQCCGCADSRGSLAELPVGTKATIIWYFASVPRAQLVKHYTPLQAFCIMLFCLLSIPCLATLAIIKRELNSWKMAFVEAGALFALAYVATLIVYQLGSVLEIGTRMLQ